jgi:hypothetical protein
MRTRFQRSNLFGPWHLALLPLLLILLTVACTTTAVPATIPTALPVENTLFTATITSPAPTPYSPINLPLTAYILDDNTGQRSSQRTAEQLQGIYEKVNAIYAPAGITVDLQAVHRVQLPPVYLTAVSNGDFEHFFSGINHDFTLPDPSLLNAFYASDIGGPNGITPFRTRTFFVTDFPSVHHERVTSHEIGHILGLHHVLDDPGRLMFSGTNGMTLSEEEITVARYAAQGLLDGLR